MGTVGRQLLHGLSLAGNQILTRFFIWRTQFASAQIRATEYSAWDSPEFFGPHVEKTGSIELGLEIVEGAPVTGTHGRKDRKLYQGHATKDTDYNTGRLSQLESVRVPRARVKKLALLSESHS